MNKELAVYKCCACGHQWFQYPEPVQCRCGSLYVEWVNYEKWLRLNSKKVYR